jgi:hypothetical protein
VTAPKPPYGNGAFAYRGGMAEGVTSGDDLDLSPDGLTLDGPARHRVTPEDLARYEREAREANVAERNVPFVVGIEAVGDLVGRRWLVGRTGRGLTDPHLVASEGDEAPRRAFDRPQPRLIAARPVQQSPALQTVCGHRQLVMYLFVVVEHNRDV